ncbi:MAG: hypothetical protein IJ838_00075 [Paludibacteraceae bacterium]|nr:hypothetical protein [Paludibacteraceae bacterium]
MNIYSQIAQTIRNIAGVKVGGATIFPAVVKQVNGAVCTITIGDLDISDVRLRAVINNDQDQILRIPKANSQVLVADMSGGEFRELVVIEQSQTEKIDLTIGQTTLVIEDGKITINGGNNGGLINIGDLTKQINTIERDINSLKTIVSDWTPVAQDGGAALKTAVTTWASQSLTETQNSNYEDTNIKH